MRRGLVHRCGIPAALFLGIGCTGVAAAPLYDGADGATCDYFNFGARIAWEHRRGDWTDATGKEQGLRAFASIGVRSGDAGHLLRTDVTALVRGQSDQHAGYAMMLARVPVPNAAGGAVSFHSREAVDPAKRPRLVVDLPGGREVRLTATADTSLDCSTYRSLGTQRTINAGGDRNAALQFDGTVLAAARIEKATLELAVERVYGDTTLGVFRIDPPRRPRPSSTATGPGIAARYPQDDRIAQDDDVLMATGFEDATWRRQWSYIDPRSDIEVVDRPTPFGFAPLQGRALQVRIPADQNLGLDMGYRFASNSRREPEEIYFRYYLRLGRDWEPRDGGKLPGLSATYSVAGWGGRKADGTSGWSMRGQFAATPMSGNPFHGHTPIGTYAYHADMQDQFGDAWPWIGAGGLLERERWYCIEQYVKVNKLGTRDGVMRAWVDGVPVFERTDLHLRDIDSIRIEQVWMNVYFGGTYPTATDLHLYIDNVVIAKRYVGPMSP